MDPVDEYARLKDDIRRLQDRAEALRAGFLRPGARLRSNRYEITVRRQKRRVFAKDRLPPEVRDDPRYWDDRETEVVLCREIARSSAGDEDIVLIE